MPPPIRRPESPSVGVESRKTLSVMWNPGVVRMCRSGSTIPSSSSNRARSMAGIVRRGASSPGTQITHVCGWNLLARGLSHAGGVPRAAQ